MGSRPRREADRQGSLSIGGKISGEQWNGYVDDGWGRMGDESGSIARTAGTRTP